MIALLLFYLRAGTRVAIKSFAPLFCAIIAAIILNMYPAELIANLARGLFRERPAFGDIVPFAVLGFALPLLGAPRIVRGCSDWLRHLPVTSSGLRRGVTLGLLAVELPLVVGVICLAAVARDLGMAVGSRLAQIGVFFVAAAFSAVPVKRQWLATPLSLAAGVMALRGLSSALAAAGLLAAVDLAAGPLRQPGRSARSWSEAGFWFHFQLVWRALGWRIAGPYLSGIAALAATELFLANNTLPNSLAAAAGRFGGTVALALFMFGVAAQVAARRPAWAWARSLPWSSSRRIRSDALFLALHALPLTATLAFIALPAVLPVLAVLPLLALRAAAHMRYLHERRSGGLAPAVEGFLAASLLALLPWVSYLALAGTVPAFFVAQEAERRFKATGWRELRPTASGDPQSWSA